jgi:hypothetical protein
VLILKNWAGRVILPPSFEDSEWAFGFRRYFELKIVEGATNDKAYFRANWHVNSYCCVGGGSSIPNSPSHHSRFSGLSLILFPSFSEEEFEIIEMAEGTLANQRKSA